MKPSSIAFASLFAVALVGCDRGNDRTAANPMPALPATSATVSDTTTPPAGDHALALDRLDRQIADAQAKVDASSGQAKADNQAKLDALKARRDQIHHNYDQARYDQLETDTTNFFDRLGHSIEHGADATGDSAKSAGDKIKDTVNGQ